MFLETRNLSWLKRIQKPNANNTVQKQILKNPTNRNKALYNKQSNYCVSLLRKEKILCKTKWKAITDIKNFLHTIKSFYSERVKSKEAIILVNNEVAKTSNYFFLNVKNLKISECKCGNDLHNRLSSNNALQSIIKYRNHPSIKTIRRFSQLNSSFCFSPVDKNTVLKQIKGMIANKAVQDTDIPIKVLKENINFFAGQITLQFNEGIFSSKYPESFKFVNILEYLSRFKKTLG